MPHPKRFPAGAPWALGSLLLLGSLVSASYAADTKNSTEAARLNNIGVALMNQQLTEKAVNEFEQSVHADPSLVTPLMNRGIALFYLQRLPEAQEALEQAAQKDPKNARVWYSLGLVQRSAGKPRLAIDDFKKVIELDPKDADTHYFLGSFYLEVGEFENAMKEYQAAIALNPVHASAEFGLARALQRLGRVDESHEHLKRFQHLTHDKISSALTSVYGEQGHYSTVQDMVNAEPQVGPMIPVSFVAKSIPTSATPPATANSGSTDGGACILDIDSAGHKDLVVLGEGNHAIHSYKNLGDGSFQEIPDQATGLAAAGTGIACAVGDYDNDGLPDLAVSMSDRILLFHNLGGAKFQDVTRQVGIESRNQPAGLTFVDYDHDGDLDLYVTGSVAKGGDPSKGAAVVWRNNGNSTFTEWTAQTGLAGEGNTQSATLSDINNDRAVDLVVAASSGAPIFYANPREGPWKGTPVYTDTALAPGLGVYVFDFNKDGWMDLAITHSGAPGVTLWRNVQGKSFERVPLPMSDVKRAWGLTAIDVDNDGWLDLAALVETSHGPQLRVFRNLGTGSFEDVTKALGLDKIKLQNPRSLIAADVNNDGAADLIVSQAGAEPLVLRNIGGNRNHSLRINLAGLADNKSAIGTKLEVFAGGLWQKWEIAGATGFNGQGPTEIVAGLGQTEHADIVRMLWPTGVPQDEIDLPHTAQVAFKELDRRGSSCPVLFAWDGSKYQFVSDVIGAAVVGHWVSPVAKNEADPDEWIKVEGSQLRQRNGYFSLRFGEPMEEINFIDQLRLVSIDHPEGTEVYPNERFLSETPFAHQKTIVASAPRLLRGAWDSQGHDVLPQLRDRDHKYVRDFTNLNFAGFANPHTLTLDLGEWSPSNPLRLLMHGYIEYFSASSMYSAWQAGLEPTPPYVEAQLPDGSWKRVLDDMGFPAGLPRTIVVDLTGKLPPGTRRIRLATNLQIYWDQVLVDNGPDASTQVRQRELPLADAHLHFRGYPRQVELETPGDLTYRYDQISSTGPFAWQRGSYTHYGDVRSLLDQVDNRFVIFGSGEEIDAEFSAAPLPALPPHWKRDYFFYANGFVKDMDFYEALPFTVAEMPFQGMTTYPYPAREHYPDTRSTLKYQLDWNDRFESGNRTQPFRFDYRSVQQLPDPVAPTPPSPSGSRH